MRKYLRIGKAEAPKYRRPEVPTRLAPFVEAVQQALLAGVGASDLRGGIDRLLATAVRGFALGAQPHHACVFANRRAGQLKVLVYDDFSGYYALHARSDGGAVHGACAQEAHRGAPVQRQPDRRAGGGADRAALRGRARGPRTPTRARRLWRQQHAKPVAEQLHTWLVEQRPKLARADVTAKAIDYTLSNWTGLTRYLDDGNVPIDNNAAEGAVRPLAVGRKNWLAIRRIAAGRRACCGGAQPDRVGQAQRARSVGVSEGRVRAAAHPECRSRGRHAQVVRL